MSVRRLESSSFDSISETPLDSRAPLLSRCAGSLVAAVAALSKTRQAAAIAVVIGGALSADAGGDRGPAPQPQPSTPTPTVWDGWLAEVLDAAPEVAETAYRGAAESTDNNWQRVHAMLRLSEIARVRGEEQERARWRQSMLETFDTEAGRTAAQRGIERWDRRAGDNAELHWLPLLLPQRTTPRTPDADAALRLPLDQLETIDPLIRRRALRILGLRLAGQSEHPERLERDVLARLLRAGRYSALLSRRDDVDEADLRQIAARLQAAAAAEQSLSGESTALRQASRRLRERLDRGDPDAARAWLAVVPYR